MFDVTFGCNAMQSGSVFFYYSPTYVSTGTTVSTDFVSGAVGCIVEYDPVKKMRIKVPWATSAPCARVRPVTVFTNPTTDAKSINGFLVAVVMNPLAAPYAATISMVIEMSVDQDIVIGGARPFNEDDTSLLNATETSMTLQGTITQVDEQTEECWLVGEQPPISIDGVVLSAKVTSIKVFCQRFCPYPSTGTYAGTVSTFTSVAATNYDTIIGVPFYPTPPCPNTSTWYSGLWPATLTRGAGATSIGYSTGVGFTMIGWLSAMFTGCKGGMSHKVLFPFYGYNQNVCMIKVMDHLGYRKIGDTKNVDNRNLSFPSSLHGITHYSTSVGNNITLQALEFTLPYTDQRRFYPCCGIVPAADEEAKWAIIRVLNNGEFSMQMWSAGAADFSLIGFRFTPAIL